MRKLITICAVALILTISGTAQASLTEVTYENGKQDPLWGPLWVHELGNQPPFPTDEWITSSWEPTHDIPCPIDYTGLPNVEVFITNMTGKSWTDLWYVADPETTLTNDDGWINGQLAFKIDNGPGQLNQPLIFESMAPNLIFEVGETWGFVIQEYTNAFGLAPSLFGTIGVPSVGDLVSSGSIIAIPAPGAILLGSLGVGLVGWLRRRRTL